MAILVALFAADETLLTWVATDPKAPISTKSAARPVAAWTRSMAARNEGDFPGAIRYFTTAMEPRRRTASSATGGRTR